MDELSGVTCKVPVSRQFPTCEHTVEVGCSVDINKVPCQALCDGILSCCGRPCKSKCYECQSLGNGNLLPEDEAPRPVERQGRSHHKPHRCDKPLHCQHSCPGICGPDHTTCNEPCTAPCRQVCSHSRCPRPCSKACTPCQEPCTWLASRKLVLNNIINILEPSC